MSAMSESARVDLTTAPPESADVKLKAKVEGHTVVCHLECNGQRAKITFDGHHVTFDVVEPPAEEA